MPLNYRLCRFRFRLDNLMKGEIGTTILSTVHNPSPLLAVMSARFFRPPCSDLRFPESAGYREIRMLDKYL